MGHTSCRTASGLGQRQIISKYHQDWDDRPRSSGERADVPYIPHLQDSLIVSTRVAKRVAPLFLNWEFQLTI